MHTVSVLVVEDDLIESIRIENSLTELGFKVLPIADNVKDALGLFYTTDPDIVIIDINLKGDRDGIELGNHITSDQKYIKPIIYLTSIQDSEVFQRAKSTNPHAFLVKPSDPGLLQRTIELALQHFAERSVSTSKNNLDQGIMHRDAIFVKKGKKMVRLGINDICYIEVESKYCTLFTESDRYIVRISLKELIDFLPVAGYHQVSRNYVVNISKINEFDLDDMTLQMGKTHLSISPKYKKTLMLKLGCIQ